MGIYLRENGIYYLKARVEGKYKRVSLETSDRSIAQEIYNAYLIDKLKSKLIPSKVIVQNVPHEEIAKEIINKTKIKPLYQEYMESCKLRDLVPSTMWYKEILLEELTANKILYLEDINQKSINSLLQFWTREKPSCIRKQTANLKAFLNYCIKSQKFSFATYHSITFPKLIDTGIRETIITESDYKYMQKAIKDNDFLLYLDTLWEVGCRPNEIVSLQKSDIDFYKGTAKIYQNKTKKHKTVYCFPS